MNPVKGIQTKDKGIGNPIQGILNLGIGFLKSTQRELESSQRNPQFIQKFLKSSRKGSRILSIYLFLNLNINGSFGFELARPATNKVKKFIFRFCKVKTMTGYSLNGATIHRRLTPRRQWYSFIDP